MAGPLTLSTDARASAHPAGEVGAAAPPPLAPLREELLLEPGPPQRGGMPTWTLYDPATHRYYRIGWLEFEVLCRWHLRNAGDIAARISRETTLRPQASDVEAFARFLQNAELLRGRDAEATARMMQRKEGRRQGWFSWLLHHYLFVRIPLLRPDRLLEALLPLLSFVYSWGFLTVTIAAGLLGAYLALRQWDVFSASLPWFFSLEGTVLAGAALIASKCLHELGHGLTAKRFGCRVPSMGVALLVLAPVLYTDTSSTWRLRDRRRRLAVGVAGVTAECCLAAYALLLWSFLPDGILRSIVFVWATTTWILTILINLSPFMRFDGYYLFSDLIDVPNLQDRAFALARHQLRELLFGFGEEPPEVWPPGMRRLLVVYAVTTWLYRFFLFLGIAVLVYHMFFKLLGLFLFAVELWWFIARPIVREVGQWVRRRRGRTLNRRSAVTFTILAAVLIGLFVPWRGTVHAPAVLVARERVQLFSQVPGRVASFNVAAGDRVEEEALLVTFASPDIAYKLAQARRRVASLEAQIKALTQASEHRSRALVLARELERARAEESVALAEQDRLFLRSPITGTVVELADPLGPGEWVKTGEFVGVVADTSAARIEAYVAEADLGRIEPDATAVFVPADPAGARVPAHVATIHGTAIKTLSDQELASIHGGALATRRGANDTLVPEVPVYRVTLKPHEAVDVRHTLTGTVLLEGQPASIAGQVWRRVLSVAIRESGF